MIICQASPDKEHQKSNVTFSAVTAWPPEAAGGMGMAHAASATLPAVIAVSCKKLRRDILFD
jgi:hypothetical protein